MASPGIPGRPEPVGTHPAWRSTVTGRVDVTALVHAGRRVTVRVHVPPGYEQSSREHGLLIMFDGQNLFDRASSSHGMEWEVDETVERLTSQARLDSMLVVGVDSPDTAQERYAQYTAWDWELDGVPVVARGEQTADFLVGPVLDHVRDHYRVTRDRSRVGLAGSSLGGYMTLYVGTRHSELFGRLLAFSPVLLNEPMRGDALREYIARRGFEDGTRVYLDMGGNEELSYVDDPARLVADLAETTRAVTHAVRPPQEVVSRVIPGAGHDERAWAARFEPALLWAFADGPAPR